MMTGRPTDTAQSAALTALIVRFHDDDGLHWKEIAHRVGISGGAVFRRYQVAKAKAVAEENARLRQCVVKAALTDLRNQELEGENAQLAQQLSLTEEKIAALRAAWSGNALLRNHPAVRALLGEA